METNEAQQIIKALKEEGKKYFKPLPYHDVRGGSTITFDANTGQFTEHYLNESVWDRGREEYTKTYSEEALLEMFLKEGYTDRKYVLPKKNEDYRLE